MRKACGLISMIDARLVPDDQKESTPGEAVAGMLLNGLGGGPIAPCRSRPNFLPTHRSICCGVLGGERSCSIASSLAGRSRKSRPMGVSGG